MSREKLQALTLATAGCAILFGSQAATQGPAQEPARKTNDTVKFAAPKRIKAGDGFLGEGRLYPSPVLHDVDGDKIPDVVVGDLFGKVTFARRETSPPSGVLGAEQSMKDRSGEQLKFHNW